MVPENRSNASRKCPVAATHRFDWVPYCQSTPHARRDVKFAPSLTGRGSDAAPVLHRLDHQRFQLVNVSEPTLHQIQASPPSPVAPSNCIANVPSLCTSQDPFPTGLATKPSKDAASCGNQAAIAEQLRLLQRPSRRRISRFVEPLHAAAPFRRAALTAAGVAALALCSLRHVRAQTSPPAPCVLRVRGAFFRFASAVDYNLFGIASRWRMCGRSPLCRSAQTGWARARRLRARMQRYSTTRGQRASGRVRVPVL